MHLYIATPCHGWEVSAPWLATREKLVLACRDREWSLTMKPWFGISDLIKARNVFVHRFLKSGADKLITFDADQGAEPQDFFALAESPHGVSACPVVKKQDNLPAKDMWNYLVEPDRDPVIEGDFMRVACVGAGMMCIDRATIMKMCYENPFFMVENEPVPELYARDFVNADALYPLQFSEDYSFCLRARKVGEPPWVYIPGKVQHMGTKIWMGSLHV